MRPPRPHTLTHVPLCSLITNSYMALNNFCLKRARTPPHRHPHPHTHTLTHTWISHFGVLWLSHRRKANPSERKIIAWTITTQMHERKEKKKKKNTCRFTGSTVCPTTIAITTRKCNNSLNRPFSVLLFGSLYIYFFPSFLSFFVAFFSPQLSALWFRRVLLSLQTWLV